MEFLKYLLDLQARLGIPPESDLEAKFENQKNLYDELLWKRAELAYLDQRNGDYDAAV